MSTLPQQKIGSSHSENVWLEGIKTVGLSLILALGMRTFVAEARYVPSGSMEPTIQPDDRLIIDKVSYVHQLVIGLRFDFEIYSYKKPPLTAIC